MIEIQNSSISEIEERQEIDLFLCALGFENRASYLAQKIQQLNIRCKVCVKLVESPNDDEEGKFLRLGFELCSIKNYRRYFNNDLKSIIIDYSVMMKSLYADILQQIVLLFRNNSEIKVYFSYTHSLFENAILNNSYVQSINQLLLTENKLIDNYSNNKLIIGLGYERLSAIGLIENLEINYEDVLVFINMEEESSLHYLECLKVNEGLLSILKDHQIFKLNFFDFNELRSVLESILFNFKRNNDSVIIAPMSVKTFSLFSMVLSLKYDNLKFYNVTSRNTKATYLKRPNKSKSPTVYRITYEVNTVNIT